MKTNKLVSFILSLCMLFTITSCSTFSKTMPEDFHFSLTWGPFGCSSYNSETGELIKKKDENIQTTYFMDEAELKQVYEILMDYRIHKIDKLTNFGFFFCSPPGKYEIVMYTDDIKHVIKTPDSGVDFSRKPYTIKARRFYNAIVEIKNIIYESEEWKSLPDSEMLYM